jgi:hypothetical protein
VDHVLYYNALPVLSLFIDHMFIPCSFQSGIYIVYRSKISVTDLSTFACT